jgi:hypothetical protein
MMHMRLVRVMSVNTASSESVHCASNVRAARCMSVLWFGECEEIKILWRKI